eukprot:6451735-Alexandrium_andersonii.AAC.1
MATGKSSTSSRSCWGAGRSVGQFSRPAGRRRVRAVFPTSSSISGSASWPRWLVISPTWPALAACRSVGCLGATLSCSCGFPRRATVHGPRTRDR